MTGILRGIGLAGALVAAPAAATDWDSVAGWDVYEVGATQCVVGRVFADAGTTFGIIMSVDGEVRVFATGAGWPVRAGEAVDAEVAFDRKAAIRGTSVGIEQQRNRGFVAAADANLLDGFAAAKALTVRAGTAARRDMPLTGSAAGLAQGRRCVAALREQRGTVASPAAVQRVANTNPAPRPVFNAPPVKLALASRAVPRASLASWFGDVDYPSAALRQRQEGTTNVRLAIDRSGAVAGCDVVGTSGSAALDEETCKILKRRARYRPALDAGRRPVDSVEQQTVRWKLPE